MTPRSHLLTVCGIKLHYLEWGLHTNPSLVLIHGGSAHAHWWDHIATELACEYRVLALDLRGHGDSAWATPPAYEITDYVADLEAVITTLGLSPLVLIGHSLGGFIALTYATLHAATLQALVVVDGGFRLPHSRRMRLLSRLPAPVYRDEADLLVRFRLLPEDTYATPALLQHIAWHSVRRLPDGRLTLKFDRASLLRQPCDLSSQLRDIACPTLLLRGSDSRNLPASTLTEMLALCPRAQGREIPAAGHHVFLDNPAIFLQTVHSFLDKEKEGSPCKS